MTNKSFRMDSLLFLCILFILILSSCRKEEAAIFNDEGNIYYETIIPIPDEYGVFEAPVFSDGYYYTDLFLMDENGDYFMDLNRKIISFDMYGNNITIIDKPISELSFTNTFNINNATFYCDDMYNLTYLIGEDEIALIEIPALFNYDIRRDVQTQRTSGIDFDIINIVTDGMKYYILTTEGLCALSLDGQILWTYNEHNKPCAIIAKNEALYYIHDDANNVKILSLLNAINGTITDNIELPDVIRNGKGIGDYGKEVLFLAGDSSCDIYAATSVALWRIEITTDQKGNIACVADEQLNWLNSGISPTTVSHLCIGDGNTLAAIREYENKNQLVLLSKASDEQLLERKTISLALLSEDQNINNAIYKSIEKYNRSLDGYSIIVKDFTIYDKELRTIFLNAEIASKHIPDIVILSTDSETDSTVYTYTHNGVFCDLIPLMKSDDTFNYDNLLGYVNKPYLIDDKQLFFPLTPQARTQFGSSEFFKGAMTFEEVSMERQKLPSNVCWTNNNHVFKIRSLEGIMNDYIDFKHATCFFTSDEFVAALNELNNIPDSGTVEGLKDTNACLYALRQGNLRLFEYNPDSLISYAVLKQYLKDGIVAVGYPNSERRIFARNYAGVYFAVTQASKEKNIAIDFLEDILKTIKANKYGKKYVYFEDDVYKQLNDAKDKTIVITESSTLVYDDIDLNSENYTDKTNSERFKLTDYDAEEYISYLNSIEDLLPTDSPIYQIYDEECFSSFQRSASDTAKIIQSRVSIFLSEQYD